MSHSSRIDPADALLLDLIQQHIPLLPRPFQELGNKLALTEQDVIRRIIALKSSAGIIRQISAIFDSKALGYQSTLVAASVHQDRIDHAAQIINRHPGVSHNYQRDHAFNLWYTLAVPPDSTLGLHRTVQLLHQQSDTLVTRLMPALRVFKLGVILPMSQDIQPDSRNEDLPHASAEAACKPPLTQTDKEMIRILQQDLPVEPQPFDIWAQQAQTTPDDLLTAANRYLQEARMRRFSAVLNHRQAGFPANAMGVWVVPTSLQETFGQTAATFQAVSHCYLRPTYDDWPYSIFTMIHARSTDQCQAVLQAISQATGMQNYAALYSTRQFKKSRIEYFTEDIHLWERQAAPAAQSAPKSR